MRFLFILLIFSFSLNLSGQSSFENWQKLKDNFKVQPYLMVQSWATFSHNQQLYNQNLGEYELVDNRFNFQLRRMRFGLKAAPYEFLKFNFMAAYDLIGRDVNAATMGGFNNGAPNVSVFDVQINLRLLKNDLLWLTAGYFRPQLGRESITSGWSVNSFEKAMSQTYLRKHLVGQGPGRAAGLNLGGNWTATENFAINYNLGLFNPMYLSNSGNSMGSNFAPLVVGRMVLQIGDPEQKSYKLGYNINYFNERKGLSLGIGASHQGETPLFDQSQTLAADLLFNWGALNFDADWSLMYRKGQQLVDSTMQTVNSNPMTGHARLGYNIIVAEKYFIEPVVMLMWFEGAMDQEGQTAASGLGHAAAREYALDAGLNWYLNKKKLKLSLHYVYQMGDAGDATDGNTLNSYFNQRGVGAIQRGSYLGLGLNFIL
jgi:hypothetical protein